MNRPLDELLRDPRAHGGEVESEDVRRWAESAVLEWKRTPALTRVRARRARWQDLGVVAALAVAAAVLLPMFAPSLVAILDAFGNWSASADPRLQLDSVGSRILESPVMWATALAAVMFATVPQLREWTDRLARG